jgi:hypothetical protein
VSLYIIFFGDGYFECVHIPTDLIIYSLAKPYLLKKLHSFDHDVKIIIVYEEGVRKNRKLIQQGQFPGQLPEHMPSTLELG